MNEYELGKDIQEIKMRLKSLEGKSQCGTPGDESDESVYIQNQLRNQKLIGGVTRAQAPICRPATGDVERAVVVSDRGGWILDKANLILWYPHSFVVTWPYPTEQVTAAIRTLVQSPYMNSLSQYRGIQRATVQEEHYVMPRNLPVSRYYNDETLQILMAHLLTENRRPAPDRFPQSLHCIILPPGVVHVDRQIVAAHSYFRQENYLRTWLWVSHNGSIDSITESFSHELVEACTDPYGDAFQVEPRSDTEWNEIADSGCGCQSLFDTVNGIRVQKYWSAAAGRCVSQ